MRTSQEPKFLSTLIQELAQGQILPAGMQRPYVWRASDVLAFCESLMDALPIGALLTWRPGALVGEGSLARPRLGPITTGTPGRSSRLVLDGQNRLATLAWMINETVPEDLTGIEAETWGDQTIVIDVEAGGLVFVPRVEAETGLRMSCAGMTTARFQPHLRRAWTRWEAEGFSEAACEAQINLVVRTEDRIREARVIETLIDGGTPEEARSIFLRVCRTGVPMSDADFDAALAWLPDAS